MNAAAPFYAEIADAPAGARALWLTASDGVRLRAAFWRGGARGTAIVFPGRTEFIEKYGRVVGRLTALGLSVAVIDWRGQGLSDRSHASLGHVEDFLEYQRDVAALMSCDTVAELPEPRYLLAHSMGGCIGLRTLRERSDFCGALLTAPMWRLQMRAATREITSRMTQLAGFVGLGRQRIPGTARGLPAPEAAPFAGNALTSDPEHFAWAGRQIAAHPELGLGGPSMQWTYAAIEEMARLYVAPLPKLPITVFLGTGETVVSSSAIRAQVSKMPEGVLVMCAGARHELLMERPEIQAEIWRRIAAFVEAVPPRRRSALSR